MSIDRELEQQDNDEIVRANNPDYLQEQSTIVASLKNKQVVQEVSVLENVSYSQRAALKAQKHIDTIENELAKMRSRGDYGIPEVDAQGNPVQDDMSFIETPTVIPQEVRDE